VALTKSILKPPESVAVGVGIGVVDAFIFQHFIPNMADVRSAEPHNTDVDAARRQATGACIAVNGLVSLMTRDWNVFLIGGVVTVALSYAAVHANAVNPQTGNMQGTPGQAPAPEDQDNAMPMNAHAPNQSPSAMFLSA
jgi:hypothetical protein